MILSHHTKILILLFVLAPPSKMLPCAALVGQQDAQFEFYQVLDNVAEDDTTRATALQNLLQKKDANIDINAQHNGRSPLNTCAINGWAAMTTTLLQFGAIPSCGLDENDFDNADSDSFSTLHNAVYSGEIACLKAVLKSRTVRDNIDVENSNEESALLCAVSNLNLEMVRLLILCGASCTKYDLTDNTGSCLLDTLDETSPDEMAMKLLLEMYLEQDDSEETFEYEI